MVDSTALTTYLKASVLLVAVLSGLMVFMSNMDDQYVNTTTNITSISTAKFVNITQYEATFNATAGEIETKTTSKGFLEDSPLSLFGIVISGFRSVVTSIKDAISAIPKMINSFQDLLGIPTWFVVALGSLFSITLAASIFRVIFGKGREL